MRFSGPTTVNNNNKTTTERSSSSKTENNNGVSMESVLAAGAEYSRQQTVERIKDSKVINPQREIELPRFAREELILGKLLGKGSFGEVYEIRGFKSKLEINQETLLQSSIRTTTTTTNRDKEELFDIERIIQGREFIAKHCLRNEKGEARYAVKFLQEKVYADPSQFIQGTMDFAVETSFLSSIEHPNIVKMRACATCDPFHKSYFIVLDLLQETLECRLLKWEKMQKRKSGLVGKMITNRKGSKTLSLLEERLVAAFDISAALEHLHNKNIIYRDLKPENIGFDIRGDVKLFDFGLAKELHPEQKDANDTYELSGKTGSLRYMAPEVALSKPYNFSADTYSFSILLWEMISLSIPFPGYSIEMHRNEVVVDGVRPPIKDSWSMNLRSIMKRGWCEDIYLRPQMSSVSAILKKEISTLRGGDDAGLEHSNRRSTHIFVFQRKKSEMKV